MITLFPSQRGFKATALEDLKVELIEGQRLATDEQGTVLVLCYVETIG